MAHLNAIDPATATGKTSAIFNGIQKALGLIPNMTKVMANSPAVLESYAAFSGALGHGQLDAPTREQLALAISQQNHCDYCLSAHTTIGKLTGLTQQQILDARKGVSESLRTQAALTFARCVLDTRGQISEADLTAARSAGFSDGEIAEIIAHVALNVFTNYFNNATGVAIDFPAVSHTEIA